MVSPTFKTFASDSASELTVLIEGILASINLATSLPLKLLLVLPAVSVIFTFNNCKGDDNLSA